jgi:choline dehydrogenase-like flavoprotein
VHDIDGLYVVDASVLPSAGAVNTGLTIAALALRAGDALAGVKLAAAGHRESKTSEERLAPLPE